MKRRRMDGRRWNANPQKKGNPGNDCGGKNALCAFKPELGAGHTVPDPADGSGEVSRVVLPLREVVISQRHVVDRAVLVRRLERDDALFGGER